MGAAKLGWDASRRGAGAFRGASGRLAAVRVWIDLVAGER